MESRRIRRTFNPIAINHIINHSSIKEFVFLSDEDEYLDVSDLIADDRNYFFVHEKGCLIFLDKGDNVFEGNIYFPSRKRGNAPKELAVLGLKHMFLEVGALKIKAETPEFNKKSMFFMSGLGFRRVGVRPNAFVRKGSSYNVIEYELERSSWEVSSAR